MKLRFLILCCCAPLLLAGCGDDAPPITGCDPVAGLTPICGFSNPEDIELLPDGKTLLISQMGRDITSGEPGSLLLFNTENGKRTPLWPPAELAAVPPLAAVDSWGQPECATAPSALAPHGISLRQRRDGHWQLAVVNHGGRESVELFELTFTDATPGIRWRGCVPAPAEGYWNDVALLRDGGFVVSHMFDKGGPHLGMFSWALLRAMAGADTGYVLEWQPGQGLRQLAGSHGAFVNGVELSADERYVFANVYFGGEIRKLDRQSGEVVGRAAIAKADNLAWDAQGRLLALAHTGGLRQELACFSRIGRTCELEFAVHRIDPETMRSEEVLRHGGAPMGAATVARQAGNALYLGTFTGDRLLRVDY